MLVMYSKDNCPQCSQAEMLMKMNGVDYKVVKMGVDMNRDEIVELFSTITTPPHKSFPMITIKGDKEIYLGGLNDLKNHLV